MSSLDNMNATSRSSHDKGNMMLNIDRYDTYLAEGRLLRHTWVGTDAKGRQAACWLAALSDEVADGLAASYCPADDLPTWFARLIPWMDDTVSQDRWLDFAKRLGATLRVQRSREQWAALLRPSLAVIVGNALRHANDTTRPAIEAVMALLLRTEEVSKAEWLHAAREAQAAAEAAWRAAEAAWRAAEAAWRAAEAAEAAWRAEAAWQAAEAAWRAAEAPWLAAAEAWLAEAPWLAAAEAAWRAAEARSEAADRITDGILKLLEAA